MKLVEYVKNNYEKLPKSSFNEQELVIVEETNNCDYGWGNHSYDGIGIDKDGKIFWCFSSGCSCEGSCGTEEHFLEGKTLKINGSKLPSKIPTLREFKNMVVNFSDYS